MTEQDQQFISDLETSVDYWTEGAIIEFTEDLHGLMKRKGVNQAELARRIGKSPAYITQVLHGGANFTLKTMTKLAMALGAELHVHLAKQGIRVEWVEMGSLDSGLAKAVFTGETAHRLKLVGGSDSRPGPELRMVL